MNYITKLKTILNATAWSQAQLALRLGVSFPTLNSWVNNRSAPRAKALNRIEALYLDVVGVDEVDNTLLKRASQLAIQRKITLDKITHREVLDMLTLHLTYHTNTIEGSTMTLSDVREVIFDQKVLSNRTAIEQAEARNHQAALQWLVGQMVDKKEQFAVDQKLILDLHLRLMNGIIADAGIYRNHPVRIMGSRVAVANWQKIEELLDSLFTDKPDSEQDIMSYLARFHARFEQIHPFSDGNGRTGRLILLSQALEYGIVPPLISEERKYAYYKYLEIAQSDCNYKPLEMLVAESVEFTYRLLR